MKHYLCLTHSWCVAFRSVCNPILQLEKALCEMSKLCKSILQILLQAFSFKPLLRYIKDLVCTILAGYKPQPFIYPCKIINRLGLWCFEKDTSQTSQICVPDWSKFNWSNFQLTFFVQKDEKRNLKGLCHAKPFELLSVL